ncbi:MAG: pilin [Patescibacteria group bacterium]|jgi:hypothetical protein|nr:pilin [Patescibacteria group bacterium]
MLAKIKRYHSVVTLFILGSVVVPGLAKAGGDVPTPDVTVPSTEGSIDAVKQFIQKAANWALIITGAIAILLVIYGGIMYMLSAGDEKRAAKGKQIILYTLIGVAVIVGAYFIITLVMNFLGA